MTLNDPESRSMSAATQRSLTGALARMPAMWNRFAFAQINMSEQILVA
jgi:hypothetical protein